MSPVPALLAAHFQASRNRAQLDLGKAGRVVYWSVGLLFTLLLIVPALLLLLGGGYFLGDALPNAGTPRVLGALFAYLILIGGTVGSSRVLDWERTRTFPLRLRSLFIAELIAGFGDLLPIFLSLIAASLLLGIGVAKPALLPLLPFPWLFVVGGILTLRHVLGGLASSIMKRLRTALIALCIAGAAAAVIASVVRAPSTATLLAVIDVLPTTQSIIAFNDLLSGRLGMALIRQLYPVALLAILVVLAAWTLRRESQPDSRGASAGADKSLWTFSSPAAGIAKLHCVSALGTTALALNLIGPLLSFFIFKMLIGGTHDAFLLVPAVLSWTVLMNAGMQLNQFGLDGSGVKALLVLPIESRDLLKGKALALSAMYGVQILLLLVVMSVAGVLRPSSALAAVCLAACQFLLHVGVGHWASAQMPRSMPRNPFKSTVKTKPAPLLMPISLGLTIVSAAMFGGTYVLAARSAPALLLPIMAALLAATALAYWLVILPLAARHLSNRREVLVLFLS
jgi:hypothetical protein